MIGILNEKPSQMRNFAKALGGNSGTYNGEEYVLVAARGHLYGYIDPDKMVVPALSDKYKNWNLSNLPWDENDFTWQRAKKKDAAATLKNIKDVLSKCDEIAIATDDDPTGEGELLAWEILDELNLRPKKYSRLYFTDEAPKSIQTAFVKRKPIQSMNTDMDYIKALFRCQWDYLSMQFTRIASYFAPPGVILRQGRLKSTIVLIVGNALKALAAYKKVPFYTNKFRDENGNVFSSKDEPSFPNKSLVPQTYTPSAVVIDSRDMKRTAPPKLIDLATLASMLAPKGFKAKQVQDVYQKMYEAQVVSYPRTEDKYITPEQFNELLPKIDAIAALVGVDTRLLTHRTPRNTHVKTGCAHGANRPGTNVPKSLNDLQQYGTCAQDIYTILARNYLAMLGEDYEYESQKGHLEKYPSFIGSASVPKKMGYKAIFSDMDDDDSEETSSGLGSMASPFIHEGFPPKPPIPTMKWLMKQLEKYDVGTGATRTSTYAEMTNEKSKCPLLCDKKGKITLTEYGKMSYGLLPDTNIGNIKITEQVMSEMKLISQGKANPAECLRKVRQLVIEDVETMKKNSVTMRKELGIMEGAGVQKDKVEGVWNGKPVKISAEWGGHKFTQTELDQLFDGYEIEITGLISKAGKEYGVTGKLAEQTYNGHKFVGFMKTGFANSGSKGIPNEWCQHKFTDDEKTLLEQGKSIALSGCVSSKGRVFDCKVHYGENDQGRVGIVIDK